WKLPKGHDTGIKVKNSYGCLRQEKSLVPLIVSNPKHVTWYACGPTVYDKTHVGHASSYIRFDTLRRILTNYFGLTISMVMGVTNIDDKIIARANLLKKEFLSMANEYENQFKRDLLSLNILPPVAYGRVSDVLPQLMAFIHQLIEQRHAYVSESGNVWFNVDRFTECGRLVPVHDTWNESSNQEKLSARDFALWKAAKPGEPYWEAPWGNGRPGWHLECSTIASLYFGKQIDIHTGASDLEFPHHESEILQSEAFHCGDQWANYFLHSGLLNFGSTKMSKSLGNVIDVQHLVQKYSADILRYLCLSTSWHANFNYSEKFINQAKKDVKKLQKFLKKCQQYIQGNTEASNVDEVKAYQLLDHCKETVYQCMCDNFDTQGILAALQELCGSVDEMFGDEIIIQNWEPGSCVRSSTPFVHILTYVTETFSNLGFTNISAHGSMGNNESTQNNLIKFRTTIRDIALQSETTDADIKTQILKECDNLRGELSTMGYIVGDK
uniref:cysteine--tRNA ligase n=1 Tax=Ciona savignyi TaxID=51511 RepID=H2Y4L4_CIOSA